MFCWDDYDRREILEETAPHLVDSICVYRAGYVAEVCYFRFSINKWFYFVVEGF